MKKINALILVVIISVIFYGCGSSNTVAPEDKSTSSTHKETVKLVVGATPVPHGEILNFIKPELAKEGIDLEVKEFSDYVTPNVALSDKQIDANFFQHVPYMNDFAEKKGLKLIAAAKVHLEPLGGYSDKIKSKDEIGQGAKVAIPNDATNEGRALLLLQKEGLIKLKSSDGLTQTPKDIIENPKNLKFSELEAAQLPRVLKDVDLAVINTNYALEGNLNPTKDALFLEDKESPYANVLTVRPDNENDPAILLLIKALNSDEVKKFIEEKYKGAIIPAF